MSVPTRLGLCALLAVLIAGCEAVSTPNADVVQPPALSAPATLSNSLRTDPMMDAVANRYPKQWETLLGQLESSIAKNAPDSERFELIARFRAGLAPRLRELTARMPDSLLPEFFAVKADTYAYHAERTPDKCELAMHSGRRGRLAMQQLFPTLPARIRQRHVDIMVRIVRETERTAVLPDTRLVGSDQNIDAALWTSEVPANACEAFAARIKRIATLSPSNAARIYRSFLPGVIPQAYRVPAQIRVLQDQQTIEVQGRLGSGTSEQLNVVLRKLDKPGTVMLDSEGGLLSEGQQIARTITQLELDTRVENSCASACTIAFLAGRNRLATPDAMIGFHQAGTTRRFGAANYLYRSVADYRRLYNQQAMTDDFLARVANTPMAEVWYPTQTALLRNGIITDVLSAVADGSRLINAPSSANKTLRREQIAKRLLALAPVQAFATRFPGEWHEEKLRLDQMIEREVEHSRLGRFALARVFGRYQTLKPYARDELVIDAVRYLNRRMNNALNHEQASASSCSFRFLDSADTQDIGWQQAIVAGVIATAEPRAVPVPVSAQEQWRAPWNLLRERISERDWRIAWSRAASTATAIDQCTARSAVLRTLLEFPVEQTTSVARRLWNEWM